MTLISDFVTYCLYTFSGHDLAIIIKTNNEALNKGTLSLHNHSVTHLVTMTTFTDDIC